MKNESKMLQSLDDATLVEMYRKGEPEAFNVLLRRYSNKFSFYAHRFYYKGMTYQDSVQEGAVGLFKAVLRYQPERGASFHSFAEVHIRGQVINAIKGASRNKHRFLNNSVSLHNAIFDDGDFNRMDFIKNTEPSPEEFFFRNIDDYEEKQKINFVSGSERNFLKFAREQQLASWTC